MSRDAFDKKTMVKTRSEYVDYDYMDSLDEESKQWLAQFTDEYYGAAFKISTTYVKKEELIPHLEKIIKTEKVEWKKERLKFQLELYSESTEKFIQVSRNPNKKHNIDLRKLRAIKKYYKNENGRFVTNEKYKYQDIILKDGLMEKSNKAVNSNQRDIMAIQTEFIITDENKENIIIANHPGCMSPEEILLYREVDEEIERLKEEEVI